MPVKNESDQGYLAPHSQMFPSHFGESREVTEIHPRASFSDFCSCCLCIGGGASAGLPLFTWFLPPTLQDV